jgi:hypothetical protein
MKKNYMPIAHTIRYLMTGYYDAILGLIPMALFGITGVLTLAGIELTTAVPIGATVSVALIGHAMFVRAPVDPESAGAGTPDQGTEGQPSPTTGAGPPAD